MTLKEHDPDEFVSLMAEHGTLGDLISSLSRRLRALEPIREFISVIRDEYAGRVAGDDSAVKILAMPEDEREKIAQEYEAETKEEPAAVDKLEEPKNGDGNPGGNGG